MLRTDDIAPAVIAHFLTYLWTAASKQYQQKIVKMMATTLHEYCIQYPVYPAPAEPYGVGSAPLTQAPSKLVGKNVFINDSFWTWTRCALLAATRFSNHMYHKTCLDAKALAKLLD